MANLRTQLENTLWGTCPIPEWDVIVIEEEQCTHCQHKVFKINVEFNDQLPEGFPTNAISTTVDQEEIEQQENLSEYCRKLMNSLAIGLGMINETPDHPPMTLGNPNDDPNTN